MREMVRRAKRLYRDQGITPIDYLEGVNDASADENFKEGTPITVTSNGQTVTVENPYPRGQALKVSGLALDYVEAQTDPLDPALPDVTRRMTMNFGLSTCT